MTMVHSVLVLNDFCHVQGGASRVAIDEALALRALGLDVTFLGAVGPVDPALTAAGIRTVCLHQPQLLDGAREPAALLQALWNSAALRATRSVLGSLDPRQTVVHLHGYTKALTTTPVVAARKAGFAVVCTLHDFFAACPNGAFYDYRQQAPCTLRALGPACLSTNCDKRHASHKAYRVARGMVQRHAARFPRAVREYITLSEQSARLLRPYLPRDAQFHALANVIDVACDPPVEVGGNDHLVAVGRLDAEKGVMHAVTAARQAGLDIVFVGDGPLRAEVEAAGGRVTGWLSAPDVRREVERARCLVFPSLWYETYGLVVDEAAARGVPSIVSDISAAAERVAHGDTGWVFPSGDIQALQRCMAQTRDDNGLRRTGLAAYHRYWCNPSDPAVHAQHLAVIYDRALTRNGAH